MGGGDQREGDGQALRDRFLVRPNGDNPTVKAANEFYVPDDDDGWSLPSALGGATAAADRNDEGALLKGGQALGYAPSYTGSTR